MSGIIEEAENGPSACHTSTVEQVEEAESRKERGREEPVIRGACVQDEDLGGDTSIG